MKRDHEIIKDPKRFLDTFLVAALTAIAVGLSNPAHAPAAVAINIIDDPGEGFKDPGEPDAASTAGGNDATTLGEQRAVAFAYAANIWDELLNSSQTIFIGVAFDPLLCEASSANLGATGTNTVHRDFIGAPISNTWYPAALANSIAGTDLAPSIDDISAVFNSAVGDTCAFPRAWYFGLDGNPPGNTIDFVSVVLHELGHGLGFQTFMNLATGEKLNGFDDIFMVWLEDHATGERYPEMTDAARASANINTGNLHWVGPDVVNQSGSLVSGRDSNGHVEMYGPNPLDTGSSVLHFSTSLNPDQLMEPSFTGTTRDVGLAAALMQDIGWFITSQPTATTDQTTTAPPSGGGGGGGCFISSMIGDFIERQHD
jgi:hypothetical protein